MSDVGPVAPRSGAVTVTGEARAVQQRTEWVNEHGSRSIWTFRLDATDQNGARLGLVQVEMRGITFEGTIADGDSVRVSGRWHKGSIRAEDVQNLTMGTLVRAKNYRGLKIAAAIVFVVGAGVFAFFAIDSSRDAAARHEEFEQKRQEIMEQQQGIDEEFCETAKDAGITPPGCEE